LRTHEMIERSPGLLSSSSLSGSSSGSSVDSSSRRPRIAVRASARARRRCGMSEEPTLIDGRVGPAGGEGMRRADLFALRAGIAGYVFSPAQERRRPCHAIPPYGNIVIEECLMD